MKKGAKKHVAASATLSLGENSYEHLERIRGKKRKKASKEQNVVVLQEEVTSALLPTAANILPQGWGNYSENEAEKEYHGKSTPGKLLFTDVLVKHEVKDLQFQLQNDDYPQLFDLERECRNCQVLKFENSNLKIELERQNRIIDGLLPKKKKFIDDEQNKTKDYETQRSLSRKSLAEKIGYLCRALYVGRLMHALPFPSVDDVKNCFNSLIEFLDSLNLTDAGHLLNINTRRDIQRFICIEDDRCFTHCLNEIDTIIKSRLLNANFDFEAKSVLHVLGKLRSNIVDSILDKILLNLNIPFKMIKRRNKLVVVADKDNSFMSVFVNDEMLHPEFWVNDRLMCLKKSIQDSIPSFPLRNIDLYLSECSRL